MTKKNYSDYLQEVIEDAWVLQFVPRELCTKEFCKIAVAKNWRVLQFVPAELRNEEIRRIAVQQGGMALQFVPEHLKTEEICRIAVQQDVKALRFVPKNLKTKELCKIALEEDGRVLQFVPAELRNEEICKIAVVQYGEALRILQTTAKYTWFKIDLYLYIDDSLGEILKELKEHIEKSLSDFDWRIHCLFDGPGQLDEDRYLDESYSFESIDYTSGSIHEMVDELKSMISFCDKAYQEEYSKILDEHIGDYENILEEAAEFRRKAIEEHKENLEEEEEES